MVTIAPSSRPCIDGAHILKAASSMGVLGTAAHTGPRIMAMLCNPAVSSREVAGLLKRESGLCARVLRVANSAYYGRSRCIATVECALLLLGLDAVRAITAAACLDRTMIVGNDGAPIDVRRLLHHSLATAVAAESLARINQPSQASDALIAGLLHNLGITLQMRLDPRGVKAMIDMRRIDATCDMRALEAQCASVGHEECIAVVFEAWQLPESLVAVGRHHHEPAAAPQPHRELVALVNLAANLALASGYTFPLEPQPVARNPWAMALLGLGSGDLDRCAADLIARVSELRSALLES